MQSNNISKSIFILGSDRSGTSMIAGMLNELGFQTSNDIIISSDKWNPKGYYESEELIKFNKTLLKNFQLNELELNFDLIENFKNELIKENSNFINDFISKHIINTISNNDGNYFFWKDPRLFKTFSLLENFLIDYNLDYTGILNIRKPELVSSSVYKRNSIDQNYLITYYLQGLIYNLKNIKNAIVIKSENFLNNSSKVFNIIEEFTGLKILNTNVKSLKFPDNMYFRSKSSTTHFIDPILYKFSNEIYEKIEDSHISSKKNREICLEIEKFFFDHKKFIFNSKEYSKTIYLHTNLRQLQLELERLKKKIQSN